MTKQTDHQDEGVELYEIGYLVVPTVATEQLPGVVEGLKTILTKHEAVISHEGAPALRELAYEMAKISVGKKQRFNKAYFGWVTFKAGPQNVVAIKKEVDAIAELLRFILIKTDEQILLAPPIAVEGDVEEKVAPKVSDEELDKKIDILVAA